MRWQAEILIDLPVTGLSRAAARGRDLPDADVLEIGPPIGAVGQLLPVTALTEHP